MFESVVAVLDEVLAAPGRVLHRKRRFTKVNQSQGVKHKNKKKPVDVGGGGGGSAAPSSVPKKEEEAKKEPKTSVPSVGHKFGSQDEKDAAIKQAEEASKTNPSEHKGKAVEALKSADEGKSPEQKEADHKAAGDEIKDLRKDPGSKKDHSHLALYLGIAAVAALGCTFAVSPALGIYMGSKILDSVGTSDNVGKLIDHITGKSKEDASEPLATGDSGEVGPRGSADNPHTTDEEGDEKAKHYSEDDNHPANNVIGDEYSHENMGKGMEAYLSHMSEEQLKALHKNLGDFISAAPVKEDDNEGEEGEEGDDQPDDDDPKGNQVKSAVEEILSSLDELSFDSIEADLFVTDRSAFQEALALLNFRRQRPGLVGGQNSTDTDKLGAGGLNWESNIPRKLRNRQADDMNQNEELQKELPGSREDEMFRLFEVESSSMPKTYRNPSLNTFNSLFKNSKYGELRGLWVGNKDFIWWDADKAEHSFIQDEIGDLQSIKCTFDRYPELNQSAVFSISSTQSYNDKTYLEKIFSNKSMLAILSNASVLIHIGKTSVNSLDYLKQNKIESLLDINNDYTQHVKAPTYAALKLHPASARLLKSYAEDAGIKNVYPIGEFHVTVCYSKDPITYKPMVFSNGPKEVKGAKFVLLGREKDKQYVVLKLDKGLPHERFEYAKSIGASHDFPEYMPHISIAPPGHDSDQEALDRISAKLPFPLLLDYEYADEIKARLKLEAKQIKPLFAVEALDYDSVKFKVEAVNKDTAYDILGKKLAETIDSQDGTIEALNLKTKIWNQNPDVQTYNSTRDAIKKARTGPKYSNDDHMTLLRKALETKESFNEIWDYFSKALGSDKYTYNVLQWYVGTKKNPRSMKSVEDIGRAKDALMLKDRFREQIKREPDLNKYQDLNQITFTQLEDLADILKKRTTANQEKAGYEESLIKSKQAQVLHDDNEWKVVKLMSEEAAKYYGRGTRWCTAADNNNMYNAYAKDGFLYTLLHKKDNAKWQVHFESGSFMNAKDEPVAFEESLHGDEQYDVYVDLMKDPKNKELVILGPIFSKVFTEIPDNSIPVKVSFANMGWFDLMAPLLFPWLNDDDLIFYLKKDQGTGTDFIKKPMSEKVQMVVVTLHPNSIDEIRNPSKAVRWAFLQKYPYMGGSISRTTEKEQALILSKSKDGSNFLRDVKNPSEKSLLTILNMNKYQCQYFFGPGSPVKWLNPTVNKVCKEKIKEAYGDSPKYFDDIDEKTLDKLPYTVEPE